MQWAGALICLGKTERVNHYPMGNMMSFPSIQRNNQQNRKSSFMKYLHKVTQGHVWVRVKGQSHLAALWISGTAFGTQVTRKGEKSSFNIGSDAAEKS